MQAMKLNKFQKWLFQSHIFFQINDLINETKYKNQSILQNDIQKGPHVQISLCSTS